MLALMMMPTLSNSFSAAIEWNPRTIDGRIQRLEVAAVPQHESSDYLKSEILQRGHNDNQSRAAIEGKRRNCLRKADRDKPLCCRE